MERNTPVARIRPHGLSMLSHSLGTLRCSWAHTEDELRRVQEKCVDAIGVRFPLDYLRQGRVRVFRNRKGEIVAGYALILRGPFRTLQSIPEHARGAVSQLDQSALFEVTAVWIDRSVRRGLPRCFIWWMFAWDLAYQKGKRSYIYCYDARKTRLGELYATFANPTVLYRGVTQKLPGMPARANESIELGSCTRIRFFPLFALPNLFAKFFFDRATLFPKRLPPQEQSHGPRTSHAGP